MKILVAGATGALGRQLVPILVDRGHEVTGMTRRREKQSLLRELGARPVVADALDPDAVAQAVAAAEPEVIVHQLTALAGQANVRKIDKALAETSRLRTEGTDYLLAAGRAVGARRFVAQSFAPLVYGRTGSWVKTEDDPVDSHPPEKLRTGLEAILHVESAVTSAPGIEGIVLRYGGFYGEGTSMAANPDGEQLAPIRQRKFPIVGKGSAVWSFIHIADAAEATAQAIEKGRPGIYNVVDDSPAPVRQWLPAVAEAIGAKRPRRVPLWVGRLFAGEAGVVMMTSLRGSSNEKAKREFEWAPRHPNLWQALADGKA